jgi:hypothetical protein
MGSDKSFNDARVLRTDGTILLKRQLRMLLSNLEQGEHNLQDLRKLDGISKKIEEELGDYAEELDKLTEAMTEAVREYGVESAELRTASKEANQYVAEHGSSQCDDVIITPSEWDWIKTRWAANSKLVGTRSIRADILAIDDVVQNAKGVKFTKDKQAWVQGEPEPPTQIHEAVSG